MSSPFPEKQLPLHHKITRKRTLGKLRGDSETLFGVSLVSLWCLFGVSQENLFRQQSTPQPNRANFRAIFVSINAFMRRHIVEP